MCILHQFQIYFIFVLARACLWLLKSAHVDQQLVCGNKIVSFNDLLQIVIALMSHTHSCLFNIKGNGQKHCSANPDSI